MACVLTRKQHITRRGAEACTRIELRESNPFAGQLVEVGGFDPPLTITAKFPVTEIVRHNQDDVGPTTDHLRLRRAGGRIDKRKDAQEGYE